MTDRPMPTAAHAPLSGFLLVLWCVWYATWSFVPFQAVESWAQVGANLKAALLTPTNQSILFSLAEHVGLAWPIGLWGYQWLTARRASNAGRTCLLWAALFLILVELGQCAVERRHADARDFVLSLFGVLGGIALATYGLRFHASRKSWPRLNVKTTFLGLAALGSASLCYLSVIAHTQVKLEGWDTRFPLLVGNESSRNRPWLGRLKGLALYDMALSSASAADLSRISFQAENVDARLRLGAQVIYDFTTAPHNNVVRQLAPGVPTLDLILPAHGGANWITNSDALTLVKPTLLQSTTSAKRLAMAARKSDALSVEMIVQSTQIRQSGPARIVSMSQGVSLRNFMVGQQNRSIAFRVRTPRTGLNGASRVCRSAPMDLTNGWHHVVATIGKGTARIFVDGRPARRPLYLYAMSEVILRTDWPGSAILAALLCFLPLGFSAACSKQTRTNFMGTWLRGMVFAMVPLILLVIMAKVYGHKQDTAFLLASVISATIGVLLANSLKGKPELNAHRV